MNAINNSLIKTLKTLDFEDIAKSKNEFIEKHGSVTTKTNKFIDLCIQIALDEKCKELNGKMMSHN